ncbi:MAG: ribosome small subunit-dependent GTPase A [Victivallaceae bacterium]|nr:ribosome small subunit-dependent GTPase A [Victivallaceae bacterium]
MNSNDFHRWGFTGGFAGEAALYPGYHPGRVLSQFRNLYRVAGADGEFTAEISGRFRFEAERPSDFPAVGDFVLTDRSGDSGGNAVIHRVLARRSAFIRRAAGTGNDDQVVAANIDTVFICMSLNHNFNLRRLERYFAIGWDSGAVPVAVLTKADLCGEVERRLAEVNAVCPGADVLVTSAMHEDGLAAVRGYLSEGRTVAFIGSSGVGKSTLINRLTGENRQDTAGLSNEDRGRHTTTRRELIMLPSGGMVVDTPGMRELGLESADLSRTFADIDALALRCRFSDCTHNGEPGCAVLRAVGEGALAADRFESYLKLRKEAKYDGLNSRQIEALKIDAMFGGMSGLKTLRRQAKEKNRRG